MPASIIDRQGCDLAWKFFVALHHPMIENRVEIMRAALTFCDLRKAFNHHFPQWRDFLIIEHSVSVVRADMNISQRLFTVNNGRQHDPNRVDSVVLLIGEREEGGEKT